MKNKKVLIIGGDMRQVYLANILCENNDVRVYGIKSDALDKRVTMVDKIEDIWYAEVVIGPIPLSTDQETVKANLFKDKIMIIDVFANMNKDIPFIGAGITEEIKKMAGRFGITTKDILQKDDFAISNAIATAEGAIRSAIENSNINLHGSNALVLGYGRCGKILADKLQGLNANVTVEARKDVDFSYIDAYGYDVLPLDQLESSIAKFDYIFSTIPKLIVNEHLLKKVKKECLIIDIASKPGSVDFEAAKELGLKAILELGLPGRTSPKSSAHIILKVIDKMEGAQ